MRKRIKKGLASASFRQEFAFSPANSTVAVVKDHTKKKALQSRIQTRVSVSCGVMQSWGLKTTGLECEVHPPQLAPAPEPLVVLAARTVSALDSSHQRFLAARDQNLSRFEAQAAREKKLLELTLEPYLGIMEETPLTGRVTDPSDAESVFISVHLRFPFSGLELPFSGSGEEQ